MKKLVLMFAVVFGMTMVSCNGNKVNDEKNEVKDSINVEQVDSVSDTVEKIDSTAKTESDVKESPENKEK